MRFSMRESPRSSPASVPSEVLFVTLHFRERCLSPGSVAATSPCSPHHRKCLAALRWLISLALQLFGSLLACNPSTRSCRRRVPYHVRAGHLRLRRRLGRPGAMACAVFTRVGLRVSTSTLTYLRGMLMMESGTSRKGLRSSPLGSSGGGDKGTSLARANAYMHGGTPGSALTCKQSGGRSGSRGCSSTRPTATRPVFLTRWTWTCRPSVNMMLLMDRCLVSD